MENKQQTKHVENAPTLETDRLPEHSLLDEKPHRLGWLIVFLIFGLLGGWAFFAQIETSVGAMGKVISKGYKKMIQHPQGGIVRKLYVKEGDSVKKGDLILLLDDVSVSSKLADAIAQYDSELFKSARLKAESNLSNIVDFDKLKDKMENKALFETLKQSENGLFESNIKTLKLKTELLRDKNRVLQEQIKGLEATIDSNQKQLRSYQRELKKWRNLYSKNMTDELKLLERERKIEQIRLSIDQAESRIQENLANIQANKNQIEFEKSSFMNQARRDFIASNQKVKSLKEQIVSFKNAKDNLLVKSPDDGVIVDMSIHTAGEVVIPRKPIAYVVPKDNKLIIEAFIAPTDIDKVRVGQKSQIMFPAYVDPAAKPIEGNLTYVSADTIIPEGAKTAFYKAFVQITPKGQEAIKENGFEIVPGMPASVMIASGKRSFMSYILLPLESLLRGAFHAN
jgi:epimerase transport system membrane fusion protein